MAGIKEQFNTVRSAVKAQFDKLSAREKAYMALAALMLFFTLAYQVYKPVKEGLNKQAERKAQLEENLKQVSAVLARYSKLKIRQSAIEQQYKGAEIKEEAVLPYLEDLIRDKAGISSGFVIQPRTKKAFGGSFEQTPFVVRFTITDFPRLVTFLRELIEGKYPMILGVVKLTKRPAGDALDVELEVNSIRRVTKE